MQNSTRFILVLALLAGGCAKRSSNAAASPPATVEGMVMGANAKALRIDVPGTSVSTTTDRRGGFVLLEVPAGSSALRFRGNGVDTSLTIAFLRPREHRRLSVSISGGRARELNETTGTVFSGQIVSVTPPSLQVDDVRVTTDSSTVIDKDGVSVGLDKLQPGDSVEVEGSLQADGTVLARRITVEPAGEGNTVHFTETLNAIDGTNLTVGVLPVQVTDSTIILRFDKPAGLVDLDIGDQLAVLGTIDAQNGIVALEIRVVALEEEDLQLFGFIAAIDTTAKTIAIGDIVLNFDDQTQVYGFGDPQSPADLKAGDLVDVQATHRADDSFYASTIERLQPPPPPGEFDVSGYIDSLDPSGLTVANKRFAVDANTIVQRGGATISFSDLQAGDFVDVEALPQSGAPPLAKLILAN